MRVINSIPWSPTEIESYRQVIWDNLIDGMIRIRAVMDELNLETSEDNSVRSSWEWGGGLCKNALSLHRSILPR